MILLSLPFTMRAINFYLKILLCFYGILAFFGETQQVAVDAGAIAKASSEIYKKLLKMRTLPYEDCGSRYDILYLNISSCTDIPCEMTRGSTVYVNVKFDDNGNDIKFLKHQVRWIINAVKTDAEISPDPCDGDDECILNTSDGKSYWATVLVNNNLPIVRGTMLWEAVDEYNDDVLCFKVPVAICA